jgi:hypothetical protein
MHKAFTLLAVMVLSEVAIISGLFYLAWNIMLVGRFGQPRLELAAVLSAMMPTVIVSTAIFMSVIEAVFKGAGRKRRGRMNELDGGDKK